MRKLITAIVWRACGTKWTERALIDAIEAMDSGDVAKAQCALRAALAHANTEAPRARSAIMRALNYTNTVNKWDLLAG